MLDNLRRGWHWISYRPPLWREVLRTPPLRNPSISDDQRNYEGELSLYVTCAWRLRTTDQVLYGWTDAADDPAQLTSTLEQLVGKRVESVGIRRPAWDLTIQFEGGQILDIFSDQTSLVDEDDNYSLFTESEILTVGPRSRLNKESLADQDPNDANVGEWIHRLRERSSI